MALEHRATMAFRVDESKSAPAGLWVLGESSIATIAYSRSAEKTAIERAKGLFPEAELTSIEVNRFPDDPSVPRGYIGGGFF
jgi:hypothetical protein